MQTVLARDVHRLVGSKRQEDEDLISSFTEMSTRKIVFDASSHLYVRRIDRPSVGRLIGPSVGPWVTLFQM